jgi:hypothetical protein
MSRVFSSQTLIGNWYESRFEPQDKSRSSILKPVSLPKKDKPWKMVQDRAVQDRFVTTSGFQSTLVEANKKPTRNGDGVADDHFEGATTMRKSFLPPHEQTPAFELRQSQLSKDPEALRAYRNKWTRNASLLAKIKQLLGGVQGKTQLEAFLAMDKNGDRAVSHAEFIQGLKDYGFPLTDDEGKRIAHMFDVDGDGTVDTQEFLLALE